MVTELGFGTHSELKIILSEYKMTLCDCRRVRRMLSCSFGDAIRERKPKFAGRGGVRVRDKHAEVERASPRTSDYIIYVSLNVTTVSDNCSVLMGPAP